MLWVPESSAYPHNLFYLMEGYNLWIGDISDPKSPHQIGHWTDAKIMRSIALNNNFIFAVTGSGLMIIDVSNPVRPILASHNSHDSLYDVMVVDTIAYLADLDDGLRIMNVSDPYHPQELALLLLPDTHGMDIEGNLAYISAKGGLSVVDISDPLDPTELGFVHTEGARSSVVDVCISDKFAFMAYGHDLPIIDVSRPNSPEVIYHHKTSSGASGVNTINDDSILLSCGYAGIFILKTNLPTGINDYQEESILTGLQVFQNYPNPFNKNTIIQYSLPSNSVLVPVRIKIFNILGQEIITLIDEMKVAGYYSINWNGKDASGKNLASGFYLYSIETEEYHCIKSMILLK